MIKAAGVILCEIFICLLLKKYNPEYAILTEIAAAVVLFFLVSTEIKNSVGTFGDMFNRSGLSSGYIKVLFRVAGIALTASFAADLCRDAGENATAVNAEFTGKVLMIAAALPVLEELIGIISKMVENI